MNIMDFAAILNFIMALIGMSLYLRNAIRCKSTWKILKFAFALNMGIGAFIYALIVLHAVYDPLVIRLNTSLLYLTFIISGILGRSKYGSRN